MVEPRRKVLVIEDEEDVRGALELMLEKAGFQATATGDPRSVPYHVMALRPDLILCDIAMPELDGYGVLKALQANPETAGTPVVILTAHREPEHRARALGLGVVDFLTKPVVADVFLARLEGIFAGLRRRPVAAPSGPSMQGDMSVLGAAGLLEVCRQNQLTGVLTVKAGARQCALGFDEGRLASADGGPRQGDQAVLDLMTWREGRFEFVPGPPPAGPPVQHPLPYLLLEGCRLQDEARSRA
jgi:DNA-binding response OmpR family regulator